MKRPACLAALTVLMLGVFVTAWLVPVSDVQAQVPEPTTAPTPTPTPTAPATQNIFHILSFPFETMLEAIIKMSGGIVQAFYSEAEGLFAGALDPVLSNPYGIAPESLGDGAATPLFRDLIQPHWEVAFSLALVLLPATLALTAAGALRQGAASVLGYIDLKEALVNWLFAAGGAAISFYALGLAHRLSLSAAGAVLFADFGERVSGVALARAFFNAPALAMIAGLFPPAALYVGFFILFLGSTLLLALCLGLAAYTALAYLLSVIAPVVIVLGTLPALRWLQALWLKATVVVFLIPLADAFLLKAGVALYRGFFDPNAGGSLSGFVASLFILGGVLSVLITLNYKVAEGVFGALAEVHRQAWGATASVMQLALSATALAAGFITGGALAGGLAAASATGGGVGPTGSGAPPPSSGEEGGSASMPGAARSATDSRRMGRPDITHRAQQVSQRLQQRHSQAEAVLTADDKSKPIIETAHASNEVATPPASSATAAMPRSRANVAAEAQPGEAQPKPSRGAVTPDESQNDREPSRTTNVGTAPPLRDAAARSPGTASPITGDRDPLRSSLDVTSSIELDANLQRARLAQNFGHLLAVATRHPAARAFGAGLQAAGAWAAHRAQETSALSELPEPLPSPANQNDPPGITAQSQTLRDQFDEEPQPGRDPNGDVIGAMRQSFGHAYRDVDVRGLADIVGATYGRAHSAPAQREFFSLALDPDNKQSPGHLLGALNAWAERHNVTLNADVTDRVLHLFASSRERRGDDAD
jgi:hypothetical protein